MNSTELFQVKKISKCYLARNFTDFHFDESNNLITFYDGTSIKNRFYCNKDILDAVVDIVL